MTTSLSSTEFASAAAAAPASAAERAVEAAGRQGWPAVCTLAELGRILTLIHGVKAPTDASLKKWSAAGAFRACIASSEGIEAADAPSSITHDALLRPRRAGRPGLRLRTQAALGRVYELWPFLADSDTHSVLELAVARTAEHFRTALGAADAAPARMASSEAASAGDLQQIQEQLISLAREMAAVRRELAQFSALRNNLITKLDDVVARTKDAFAGNNPTPGSSFDPLAEARRDRDMGIMKSTLAEILGTLERIEGRRS